MTPTVNFSIRRILRKILIARRRATALYTSPLTMDLSQVKVSGVRPFVSMHVAIYNEKRVVERLIRACTSQEWIKSGVEPQKETNDLGVQPLKEREANYEVIIADDSTDETTEIAKETLISAGWKLIKTPDVILGSEATPESRNDSGQDSGQARMTGKEAEVFIFTKPNAPTVKLIHRTNRAGFKGGALQKALENAAAKAEYIVILDADFVPYPDTIEQFVKTFQVLNANNNANVNTANASEYSHQLASQNSHVDSHNPIAAVQGYQWHVLNKSQNWVTRGVRTEYAGSYVIERSTEELYGGLKQIAGSVYAIRADILRKFGWGTSITEDFELTLRLYEAGYKVVFTPYIQVPAEAVSTIKRLIRQRMRWAEGSSFNIKVMFIRMVFGRWETDRGSTPKAQSLPSGVEPLNPRNDKEGRVWVPSKLTRAEKLEFVYFAFYYLQAAFFVIGTFSWFISETIFNARLPFWTAAFGWSLVFTNLLALPLMNIVGMFLEESEERDYVGILSFIALSYIVVPFQAYAAVKGFLEKEEGPWFRTPKTGLVTDTIKRMGLLHFTWPFGRPSSAPATEGKPIKPIDADLADSVKSAQISRISSLRFGSSLAKLPLYNPIRPSPRLKFVSRGVIAAILVFSMIMNYLAFVGDVLNRPEQNQLEAEQSGPTKLGESNLAASRPKEFMAQIEVIEVNESTKIASDVDFLYQAYLDDDNLAMFGRRMPIEPIGTDSTDSAKSGVGVVRIVYARGKFLQYNLPGIIGGPTATSRSINFETEWGLVEFGIEASRLKQELTIYSSNEVRSFLKNSNNDSSGKFSPSTSSGSNNNLEMSLTMSEGLSVRRQNEKGWQVVDESAKTTVFFIKSPTVKDVNGVSHANEVRMDITRMDANRQTSGDISINSHNSNSYLISMEIDPSFLSSAGYPITIESGIQMSPPYPVFNIADFRENNTSDYNYVVTVPGNRNKVGFNKKGANTVGYRIDTGDGLYNMEMAMRERSAAPASVEGGKITYDLGNMEAVYEVWTDRVKADYILRQKPQALIGADGKPISADYQIPFNFSGFSMIPTKNVFCPNNPEGLQVEDLQEGGERCVKQEEAGSISFWGDDGYGNINNSEIFRLDTPTVKDASGREGKITMEIANGLVPDKLVPKYCASETKDCKEPPGYYDRSGIVTLTIDQEFLDTAVYPITIDPTTLSSSASSTATAYGSQRHIVRLANGTLSASAVDINNDHLFSTSFNDGVTWYTSSSGDTVSSLAVATVNNELHAVYSDGGYLAAGGDITFKTSSNTVEDQTQTNTGGTVITLDLDGSGTTDVIAQSFDPTVTNIDEVEVYLGTVTGTPDLMIEIRESKNSSREPDMTTNALVTCFLAEISSADNNAFKSCTFADTTIDAAKNYFIIVNCDDGGGCSSTNKFELETRQPSGTDYSGGYDLFATNWTEAFNFSPDWRFVRLNPKVTLGAGRPSIIIDKNNFPAVSWSYETSGGTKDSAVRFSRAVADPQTSTNWECATAASCGYVKNTNCTTDVCGDHIQPVTGVNSGSHSVIVKAPSTATNADELIIFLYWFDLGDLFAYDTQVSGANYDGWAQTTGAALETSVMITDLLLTALAVDDGTNQRVWVSWPELFGSSINLSYLNADNNFWTSTPTNWTDYIGWDQSLSYDAQNNDIFIWSVDNSADRKVIFRKYDIANSSQDSSAQVVDVPPSANDFIYPNLKEDNAPTTDPGPKLDLVYMNNDNAMTPIYTVFYHTWHTKETRNYNNPASLPDAWNLSTASYDSVSFSVGGQDITPEGLAFKDDGTKMYVVGNANNTVYQYSLSTAWNLSTASYDSVSFSVGGQDNSPEGLAFKDDGTKMYVVGDANNTVYQYSLSTAWSLSTASYDSVSFSVGGQDNTPKGLAFKDDGTKMYVVGDANDTVYQYSLPTAWSLSTASYDSVSFSVGVQDTFPNGLAFKSDGTKMYVVGDANNTVYQYSIPGEKLTITSADNNLSFFYTESEYTDSNSDNAVYVPASTSTTSAFAVQTFKATNANSTDEIQISWNGRKVTEACGASGAACTLQIYQWGKTGCTAGWGDFDTGTRQDTTTAAGTEFTLTGNRTTNISCHYSGTGDQDDHLGANSVAVRVQTDCTTNCNLQTDVITFTFVPEKVLWLLPLALFIPRIMQRFRLNLGFRKAYVFIGRWR